MAEERAGNGTKKPGARPVQTPRQSLTRFALIFLGILALYAMFFPDVGRMFADAAGVVLGPMLGFGGAYPVITILLSGLLTTTISSVLRHFMTPWIRMARMSKIMGSFQKESMDAMRKGNLNKAQRVKERRAEMMSQFTDIQWVQFKQIGATMFMFIVFFTWLRAFVDFTLAGHGNLFFSVPWSFNAHFLDVYVLQSWILLYSLLALPFGQVLQRVLKYFSFRRRLHQLGALTETTAPEDVP
ncbi:MAG: hypothetical protein A3K65_02305 [Euryarchaeota archaeon RBG_16_68_12]|nr:MAG: hypothetical protein A3K65_02305 [Euryarchaeota archaeon RBG_16_68_12]